MSDELDRLKRVCDKRGYYAIDVRKRFDKALGPELALHALRGGMCRADALPGWMLTAGTKTARDMLAAIPYRAVPAGLRLDREDVEFSYALARNAVRDNQRNYAHLPRAFRLVGTSDLPPVYATYARELVALAEQHDVNKTFSFYPHIAFGNSLLGPWSRDLAERAVRECREDCHVYRHMDPRLRYAKGEWSLRLAAAAVEKNLRMNYQFISKEHALALGEHTARRWLRFKADNDCVPKEFWARALFAAYALSMDPYNERYLPPPGERVFLTNAES